MENFLHLQNSRILSQSSTHSIRTKNERKKHRFFLELIKGWTVTPKTLKIRNFSINNIRSTYTPKNTVGEDSYVSVYAKVLVTYILESTFGCHVW